MAEVAAWEGDFDELAGLEGRLSEDPDMCDRLFASKNEAFLAGRYLAERDARGKTVVEPRP